MEDSEIPSNRSEEIAGESRTQQSILVNYLLTELATNKDVQAFADIRGKYPHAKTIESARHYAEEGQIKETAIYIQLEPELSLEEKAELLALAYDKAAATARDLADQFDQPDNVLSDYKNQETVKKIKKMFRQESISYTEIAERLKDLNKPVTPNKSPE